MPLVSVVVPVYNSGSELDECLQSIADQTISDFEVICVDDGSTDDSADVIRRWVDRDARFTLIQQANAGGGAARNTGLAAARGDYLIFLDADDLFAPDLFALATSRLAETGADFSIHNGRPFSDDRERDDPEEPGVYIRRKVLPDHDPFSPRDIAEQALQVTTPAPWLRMYRRSFVEQHALRFLPRGVANDVGFTAEATLSATSITVIDRPLVFYRKGHGETQSSTYDRDPLAFLASMRDLRRRLESMGALPRYERSFRVQCFNIVAHALRTTQNADSYELLHRAVQNEVLPEFHLEGLTPGYFRIRWLGEAYTAVTTMRPSDSPLHPRRRGRPPSFWFRARNAIRRRLKALT